MGLRPIFLSTECMVVANDPTVKVRDLGTEVTSNRRIEFILFIGWIVLSNHRYDSKRESKKCPYGNADNKIVKKHLRAQEVAKENNLPCIYLGKYKKRASITEINWYLGLQWILEVPTFLVKLMCSLIVSTLDVSFIIKQTCLPWVFHKLLQ